MSQISPGYAGLEKYINELHNLVSTLKSELREICAAIDDPACDLTLTAVECIKKLKAENATAWAQAHRLALELQKDTAIVSKWWDSAHDALDEFRKVIEETRHA